MFYSVELLCRRGKFAVIWFVLLSFSRCFFFCSRSCFGVGTALAGHPGVPWWSPQSKSALFWVPATHFWSHLPLRSLGRPRESLPRLH
jgi:hypothetical protein